MNEDTMESRRTHLKVIAEDKNREKASPNITPGEFLKRPAIVEGVQFSETPPMFFDMNYHRGRSMKWRKCLFIIVGVYNYPRCHDTKQRT